MLARKDKQVNVINKFKEIVKAAEDIFSELHSSQADHAVLIEIKSQEDTEVPCITADEVKKAVKGMSRSESAGENGITADLIKDGGDIILEKLPSLFTKC